MIVFDTETTSLTEISGAPIDQQPRIVEFYGAKLDDQTLEQTDTLSFLCNPGILIPKESVAITGINDDLVRYEQPFVSHLEDLTNFFLGEKIMVAHNLPYDRDVLYYELKRIGAEYRFPWPPTHVCTVEQTFHFLGYRLNLGELHRLMLGEPHKEAHRAKADVDALIRIIRKNGQLHSWTNPSH